MLAQQVFCHGRHQRARQDERPCHREHDGFRHRHEQKPRHPGQEKHRHEHDADAQQRNKRRRHDLVGAVHDRRLDRFAVFKMPIDVLDGDGGIVDEDADRERKTAKRHDVEGLADRRQHHDGAEDGQRNRDRNDDGRTPASQEKQDHHTGQQRGDDAFIGDACDGAADEQRLIADESDFQRLGKLVLDVNDLLLDARDDIQR